VVSKQELRIAASKGLVMSGATAWLYGSYRNTKRPSLINPTLRK